MAIPYVYGRHVVLSKTIWIQPINLKFCMLHDILLWMAKRLWYLIVAIGICDFVNVRKLRCQNDG